MACLQQLRRWSIIAGHEAALLRTTFVLMFLAFEGIGIAHIFRPDYFVKRSADKLSQLLKHSTK